MITHIIIDLRPNFGEHSLRDDKLRLTDRTYTPMAVAYGVADQRVNST